MIYWLALGWLLLAVPALASDEHAAAPPADHEGESVSDTAAAAAKAKFINWPPINITMLRDGQVIGKAVYLLVFELYDVKDKEALLAAQPKVHDAMYRYLFLVGQYHEKIINNNLPFLKQQLRDMANYTMGRSVIKDILIKYTADQWYEMPRDKSKDKNQKSDWSQEENPAAVQPAE